MIDKPGKKPPATWFADKLTDVPTVPHWVILTEKSYSQPGYDRFDSPSTSYFLEQQIFLDKEEFLVEVRKLVDGNLNTTYSKKQFLAYHVDAFVQTKISIDIACV